MLLSFIILVLIGLAMVLDSEHNNWVRAIGVFILTIAVAICLPILVQNSIRYIKEKGIEDYLNGKVDVIVTEDQTFYLW